MLATILFALVLGFASAEYIRSYEKFYSAKLPSDTAKLADVTSDSVLVKQESAISLYSVDSVNPRYSKVTLASGALVAISQSNSQIVGVLSGTQLKLVNSTGSVFANVTLPAVDSPQSWTQFAFCGDLDSGSIAVFASSGETFLFAYKAGVVTASSQFSSIGVEAAFTAAHVVFAQNDQRLVVLNVHTFDFIDYVDVSGVEGVRIESVKSVEGGAFISTLSDASALVFFHDEFLLRKDILQVPAGSLSGQKNGSTAFATGLPYLAEGVGIASQAFYDESVGIVILRAGRLDWKRSVQVVRQEIPVSVKPSALQLSRSGDSLLVVIVSGHDLLVQQLLLSPSDGFNV